MAVRNTDPLQWNQPIVDKAGNPTAFFLRQWQGQKQVNDGTVGLQDVDILAGAGLTGGGSLGALVDLTLALDVEFAQDLVGAMLADSSTIDFTYTDAGGTFTAALKDTAVTPGTYGDAGNLAQITVDQQGRITAATEVAPEIGAFSGWALAGSWDHGISGDTASPIPFTGLANYNEILVVGRDITKSVSGILELHVSVDNGANYFTTSGDYKTIAGTGSTADTTRFQLHATNATAARSCMAHLHNLANAPPVGFTNVDNVTLFTASASPIDAVRVTASGGGNLTGGTIKVYAR